ncbi:nuclear transport factor 2 family protein, partial [Actinomadura darangshiensis]
MTVPGTFRSAVEAKDLAAITDALDPGIEFNSPVMVKPYLGRDAVAALLGVLLEVFEDFRYTDELVGSSANGAGPPAQALIFTARVAGKAVQGLDLLRFGDTGLVTGLTVMVRPLPAAMTLARVVGKRMEAAAEAEKATGAEGAAEGAKA